MPATRTHNLDGPGALHILEDAVGRSLQLGGLILKGRMQELAPVLSGRMMRSVEVSEVQKEPDGFSVLVGPTVDYAIYTEKEPWTIGKRLGLKSSIKGASIPWMRPAADDTRAEIQDFIRGAVRTTVRALAARLR